MAIPKVAEEDREMLQEKSCGKASEHLPEFEAPLASNAKSALRVGQR